MKRPLLSVIVATQGRATLPAALQSIRAQTQADEVVVVADTHSRLLSDVKATAHQFGARYTEHDAGYHESGHPQAQHGIEQATGQWLAFLGDDDLFMAGGIASVARAIRGLDRPRPLLFRIIMFPSPTRSSHAATTIWQTPTLSRGNVSAQSIVCPNDPEKLGRWGDDFDFIYGTVLAYGLGEERWREEEIIECH